MTEKIGLAKATAMIKERMKREKVEEIIDHNTVDDGHGNFITTIIWRGEPDVVEEGFAEPQKMSFTRYFLFVNGRMQAGGMTDAEWEIVNDE